MNFVHNIKEDRDETLRRCIANMYYYLEIDEDTEELRLRYKLRWSKKRFDHLYYSHEDDEEAFHKALEEDLRHKLKLTNIKEMKKIEYNSDVRRPDIIYITVDLSISKSDYLDSLFMMFIDLVPLVDLYNYRAKIDLEGVAQKYDLNIFKRLPVFDEDADSLEDILNDDILNNKLY